MTKKHIICSIISNYFLYSICFSVKYRNIKAYYSHPCVKRWRKRSHYTYLAFSYCSFNNYWYTSLNCLLECHLVRYFQFISPSPSSFAHTESPKMSFSVEVSCVRVWQFLYGGHEQAELLDIGPLQCMGYKLSSPTPWPDLFTLTLQ